MAYLEVHVVCCRGVRGGGFIEGMLLNRADPYVIVSCGGQQQRTKQDRDGGMNSNFNQSLTFHFHGRSPPGFLDLQVWDKDLLKCDDFMACGKVDIRPALQCGYMRGFFPLRSKHGWGNGEVELDIKFRGDVYSMAYAPSPVSAAYAPPPPPVAYAYPPPPAICSNPYPSYPQPPPYGQPPYSHPAGYSAYGSAPYSGGYAQPQQVPSHYGYGQPVYRQG